MPGEFLRSHQDGVSFGEPAAGRRIRRSLDGWNREKAYHSLYLPTDWTRKATLPIIVEYSGNGGYRDALGDDSSGRPEDSCFGYGLTKGDGFVWICLHRPTTLMQGPNRQR